MQEPLNHKVATLIVRYPILLLLVATMLTLMVFLFEVFLIELVINVDWSHYNNIELYDYE